MAESYGALMRHGIWDDNVTFSQMLALCPTMALTTSATNGLGMGLATLAVLVMSNLTVAACRNLITNEVRIPAFVLIIASIVTLVDMAINAWLHELYKGLGLFLPLIVVNCLILGRAESFASKAPPLPALIDGLAMGAGFALSLTVIGAIREVIGGGTLFANASLLLGAPFRAIELVVLTDYPGALIAVLPPGGFLVVGFLLAARRAWEAHRQAAAAPDPAAAGGG